MRKSTRRTSSGSCRASQPGHRVGEEIQPTYFVQADVPEDAEGNPILFTYITQAGTRRRTLRELTPAEVYEAIVRAQRRKSVPSVGIPISS